MFHDVAETSLVTEYWAYTTVNGEIRCVNGTVLRRKGAARNTSRAFTLEYCAKTVVYGTILEQNARFRLIYGSLRRSVMIDLGWFRFNVKGNELLQIRKTGQMTQFY